MKESLRLGLARWAVACAVSLAVLKAPVVNYDEPRKVELAFIFFAA
jgi:hypothetical protein